MLQRSKQSHIIAASVLAMAMSCSSASISSIAADTTLSAPSPRNSSIANSEPVVPPLQKAVSETCVQDYLAYGAIPIASHADIESSLRPNLGGVFVLTKNIEIPSHTNFEPLGDEFSPFSGTLAGCNHRIIGLNITKPTATGVGLFGSINGGKVLDLVLENAQVTGKDRVGAIAGDLSISATIENTHTLFAEVRGNKRVGGIVGSAGYMSLITNTSFAGLVEPMLPDPALGLESFKIERFGGIAGEVTQPTALLESLGVYGSIKGANLVGGLVGENKGIILASFSQASLTLTKFWKFPASDSAALMSSTVGLSGGLVGSLLSGGHVKSSYSTSELNLEVKVISGEPLSLTAPFMAGIGGLVGNVVAGSTIADSYATGNITQLNDLSLGGLINPTQAIVIATGGLVGSLGSTVGSANITRVYSTGKSNGYFSGTETVLGVPLFGGMIGKKQGGTQLGGTEHYWDVNTSETSQSQGGIGLETSQLQDPVTLRSWASNGWLLTAGRYPRLNWQW